MSEFRMLSMKGRPPAESAAMSAMVLADKPWQERADLLTAALAEARALALREAAEVARECVFPQSDPEWHEAVAFIAARLDAMATSAAKAEEA